MGKKKGLKRSRVHSNVPGIESSGSGSGGEHDRTLISASDIEKYAYCPLSWWLKLEDAREDRTELDPGTVKHGSVGQDMTRIIEGEERAQVDLMTWGILVAVSVLLGANGILLLLSLYIHTRSTLFSNFLMVSAVLWIGAGLFFFIKLVLRERGSNQKERSHLHIRKKKVHRNRPLPERTRASLKKSAWVILVASLFILINAITLWVPINRELLQPILFSIATFWVIGSWVFIGVSVSRKEHFVGGNKLLSIYIIVASLLVFNTLNAMFLKGLTHSTLLYKILVGLGGMWILLSMILIYLSLTGGMRAIGVLRTLNPKNLTTRIDLKRPRRVPDDPSLEQAIHEESKGVMLFAGVSIVLAFNSIIIWYNPSDDLAIFFEVVALLWLIGAAAILFFYLISRSTVTRLKQLHDVAPANRVTYTDNSPNHSDLLFYDELGIDGRPDYILEIDGLHIPVEVKTGKIPRGPYFSHILQITAYNMMVSETFGESTPYGIIRYLNDDQKKEFRIDFDERARDTITEKVLQMRKHLLFGDVHRNHKRPGKCRTCSRREECPERLDI